MAQTEPKAPRGAPITERSSSARFVRAAPVILVVDDEPLVRLSLRARCEKDGYRVLDAADGQSAIREFEHGVDLVLLDYVLPDCDGLELLERMKAIDPEPPVILLTAHSSVDRAVEAMKRGAYHFATKPFELEEIAGLVRRALEASELGRDARALLARDRSEHGIARIVGDSAEMANLKLRIRTVAESPVTTVLVTGESGVGKDLVARAIHAESPRASKPFINITSSALPETLLESELFGYERGAFTDARQQKLGLLEQADSGTVFLDEIGEMSPILQAKLLRFLEERAFRRLGGSVDVRPDVRVIAATNRDLPAAVREGRFREDLFYRLAVAHIAIPPLRARRGDVRTLTDYFVGRFARELGKRVEQIDPAAREVIESYSWPGNVRELKNTLERAMLFCTSRVVTKADLQLLSVVREHPRRVRLPPEGIDLRSLEQELVMQALERAGGNQTRAAALLGLNRDQIRYRIAKYQLPDPKSE